MLCIVHQNYRTMIVHWMDNIKEWTSMSHAGVTRLAGEDIPGDQKHTWCCPDDYNKSRAIGPKSSQSFKSDPIYTREKHIKN